MPMPSSLRFVLLLLALGSLAAPVSIAIIYRQDDAQARTTAEQITHGSVAAGKLAFSHYGCGGCHAVRSIGGPTGAVGPSLAGIAARAEIAGHLPNRPDDMIRWLRHPQQVAPGNGMPDQGIGDRDARDLAAYLYTLRS